MISFSPAVCGPKHNIGSFPGDYQSEIFETWHGDIQITSVELYQLETLLSTSMYIPQWGTVDAKIKNPPGGSPGLSMVPSLF